MSAPIDLDPGTHRPGSRHLSTSIPAPIARDPRAHRPRPLRPSTATPAPIDRDPCAHRPRPLRPSTATPAPIDRDPRAHRPRPLHLSTSTPAPIDLDPYPSRAQSPCPSPSIPAPIALNPHLIPAVEKFLELLRETQFKRVHDVSLLLGEITTQARRRGDRDPKGTELLGPPADQIVMSSESVGQVPLSEMTPTSVDSP